MGFKTIDVALPGHYLDGRQRPPFGVSGKPSLPPNVEVHLVEAVGNHGYHKDGDRWVEYFYVDPATPKPAAKRRK